LPLNTIDGSVVSVAVAASALSVSFISCPVVLLMALLCSYLQSYP
jgi:hypothetical protein